jgi:ribosomal subunit interface protein
MSAERGGREVTRSGATLGLDLEIRSLAFQLTPSLRAYVAEHLGAKLDKHASHILAVVVRFDDANGARRGVDKVCRVEVLIPGEPPLIVEEVEQDVRAAIDLAADRIEHLVVREIVRRRDGPRQRGHRLAERQ